MCGIAGVVRFDGPASHGEVERLLRTLDHRGPDSWGVHVGGPGAVGQNRLAIIDLVTGDPPIATPDGSIGVALNGEIYGYAAIRAELLADGHQLRTVGDTEVIAHLAERLEPVELARRLDGMFAFSVWDERRGRLILGRDRFGKKPLYWWQGSRSFVFGSEIKAILAHPDVSAELDADVIGGYLRLGYAPTPRTFFAGIRSVPPGNVLVLDAATATVSIEVYWSIPVTTDPERMSLDEAAVAVLAELRASVRRRLISDVPLGAFLSGGVDSAAVVALMAEASDRPVRTFTIGFTDPAYDERVPARLLAEHVGAEHTELVVEPEAIDLIEDLVRHFDQPFGDSSAVPMWFLSEMTRKHVTVALSGDGGDELFAGYERFRAGVVAPRLAAVPGSGALAALARALPARGAAAKLRRFGRALDAGMPDAYRDWAGYVPERLAAELAPGASTWAEDDYRRIWAETKGAGPLDRLLLLNARTYLLDDLLPKADRTSMAHALEVRAPFLDHRLAELAFCLPAEVKAKGGSLKRVVKHAVRDLVPASVLDRPKKGFGVPLDRWFRDDMRTYVASMLGAPGARVRGHIAGPVLDRVLVEHAGGRVDHGQKIWTLLTLEVFLRQRGW